MITGYEKFKERFAGFEGQYVLIGGTACDIIMENEELPFRATKDIDIVLIVESITVEFGKQFWEFIKEAGYEHLNKSTGKAQFYRFTSPIRKHKNDVFRLARLITSDTRQHLEKEIAIDMKCFLRAMTKEEVDLKSMGIKGINKESIIDLLYKCFGIEH